MIKKNNNKLLIFFVLLLLLISSIQIPLIVKGTVVDTEIDSDITDTYGIRYS